jgi:hypothetical protein
VPLYSVSSNLGRPVTSLSLSLSTHSTALVREVWMPSQDGAAALSFVRTNRAGRPMRWGSFIRFSVNTTSIDASRSGACKLYCHVDLPASAFDPAAPSRRRCGPCGSPCKDCAASAVVTVIFRGSCSLPDVISQLQAQAAQLQALDLNGLRPRLGPVGAAALKDVLPLMPNLLALALDDSSLECAGVKVLSCALVKLTQLQALSFSANGFEATGAACLASVLSSLTGLQSLDLSGNDISAAGAGCLACVLSWAASVVTTSTWCSLDAYGLGNRGSHNFHAFKRKKSCDTRKPFPGQLSKRNYRPRGRRAEDTRRFTPSVFRTRLAETPRVVIHRLHQHKCTSYSPPQYHPPFVNLQVQYQCRGKTRTIPP